MTKRTLQLLGNDKNMECANKMMTALPNLMLLKDHKKINEHQRQIAVSGTVIQNIKNEIIELMREELNEI
jgi:hypothetical protein